MAAKIYSPPFPPPEWEDYKDADGRFDFDRSREVDDAYRQKIADWCRANGGSQQWAGSLYYVPVADGAAEYMVWKLRPLALIHLPLGDAWNADPIYLKGLTASDVRKVISAKPLFGERVKF